MPRGISTVHTLLRVRDSGRGSVTGAGGTVKVFWVPSFLLFFWQFG